MKSLSPTGELQHSEPSVPVPDYAELKKRVKRAGLLARQPRYYMWSMILTIGATLASFLILFLVHNIWWQLINAVFLAVVFAQVGYLGHDAGHRQPFSTTWKNELAGLICGNLLLGMSNAWWVDKHNQHHSHPNQLDMDPDLNIPGICFNLQEARQKQGLGRWVMLHQIWLFFPMLMLVALDLKRASILFLSSEWKSARYPLLESLLVLAHWVLFLTLLVYNLGFGAAILFFLVNQAVLGFILGSAFAPNHKGMPVLAKESQLGFLQRQVLTSRNIKAGPLTDFWYGGLNYQIEHHLFPSMPRNNLRAAQQIVKQFCQEHAIPYAETSVAGSYCAIVKALSEVSSEVRYERAEA
ncbi:acyl-CoA desaturase [Ktedonosporobacter rubrisoli]|uniref:Acyl-CoA desaturase n=1 Tax=Ktedonosporobacter rubrisoli TaxID=2509675 RepID=A0A4P6JL89_KTERU|nr:acyl-CoA desaturase [Ktedonosporobacter rubrisoli]QBD75843.1 acyl-CoA desaturase [Ktedonosporobacter rubrisoli]